MNDKSLNPSELLTPEQLAERLQVGVNWIYEKSRNRGKYAGSPLPVLRCDRYLRFYWPDICDWLRCASSFSTAERFPQGARREGEKAPA